MTVLRRSVKGDARDTGGRKAEDMLAVIPLTRAPHPDAEDGKVSFTPKSHPKLKESLLGKRRAFRSSNVVINH